MTRPLITQPMQGSSRDFLECLSRGILLGDGGVDDALSSGDACLSAPEAVLAMHSAYLDAGARWIRTHSLRAGSAWLTRLGLGSKASEINWQAAQLAVTAARSRGALVAANVGPTPESDGSTETFRNQIGALLDGGSDFVCLEGFRSLEEILHALTAKHELHHCPVICGLQPSADGTLGGGQTLAAAFDILVSEGADVLAVSGEWESVPELPQDVPCGIFVEAETPELFASEAKAAVDAAAAFVAGAEHASPAHIAAAARALGIRIAPEN